jgi:hypothetical protein
MNDTNGKSGPIHFYPTEERNTGVGNVVEYCIQVGEKQPINRTQACWIITRGDVLVDGKVEHDLARKLAQGPWEVTIRGRKHHVLVHPAIRE